MGSKDREAVRQGMGDILGSSTDLLSQVLEGDRKRTGRRGTVGIPNADEGSVGSAVAHTTDNIVTNPPDHLVGDTGAVSSVALDLEEPVGSNPLDTALREMLAKPYATDLAKGPFTVTSMKINSEISERLGWASDLTKRPKQAIVSDALRLYFERLLAEG